MELGSKNDPLVTMYQKRVQMLKDSGLLTDDLLEEVTGSLLVTIGQMQAAEELVNAGFSSTMRMTHEQYRRLGSVRQECLRSMVVERLRAGALAEWPDNSCDWIAVVGPADKPVVVGRGSGLGPNSEELMAMSAANGYKQVWLLK